MMTKLLAAAGIAHEREDAADAALAYAIWDYENSVRMPGDEAVQTVQLSRARALRRWLRLHGHDVTPIEAARELKEP